MRFKIIFLFFVLILISVNIVNSDVESFAKDGAKQAICKSEKGGAACQAYSALNDPTGQLMNELGPQAMQFFSGIQDPLGTGKGIVMEKIMAGLPPEAQSAVQFYNQFQKYLGKINNFFGKDESNRYEADYEDGNAVVKKDGEPYFIVPDSYKIKEETETVTGAIINAFASEEPDITIEIIKKDQKQLQMNGYKINNAKENTEITLIDNKDGEKRLLIKNGYGDVEINGKNIKGVKDAEFIIKDNKIEFAEFTSKDGGDYNFEYRNIVYDFDVGKDERVRFNPKKNIEGKGPLKISYLKDVKGKKEVDNAYHIKGDYNIIMTKDGIPSYIDYGKNGKFCDNLKCDNLEASSKQAFTLCIGEGSFKNICPKKTNSLGYKIDKDGFEIYNSRGLIDYKVKETKINGKKGSETWLAVDKEVVNLNILNHGKGLIAIHGGRNLEIKENGELFIDVSSINKKNQINKNFIANYGDFTTLIDKTGACNVLGVKTAVSCGKEDILNLLGLKKEVVTKKDTQKKIIETVMRYNDRTITDLIGKGDIKSSGPSWLECISRIKSPDKCLKQGEELKEINSHLNVILLDMKKNKINYEDSLNKLKKSNPELAKKIEDSLLDKHLRVVDQEGKVLPDKIGDITKYEKQAECTLKEGCPYYLRAQIANINANKLTTNLNRPYIKKDGTYIGSIFDSGDIYFKLTPLNKFLEKKEAVNLQQIETKLDTSKLPAEKIKEVEDMYPKLKMVREAKKQKESIGQKFIPTKEIYVYIPPPKTPSDWFRFEKQLREAHEKATGKTGNVLTNPVPYTSDSAGNPIYYYEMEDEIFRQTEKFNSIREEDKKIFSDIDKFYNDARDAEKASIYQFITYSDLIPLPGVALKYGGKVATKFKFLERTNRGLRLAIAPRLLEGVTYVARTGAKAEEIGDVNEFLRIMRYADTGEDLIKSGLVICSECKMTRRLLKLMKAANNKPDDIKKVETIMGDLGDYAKKRNFVSKNFIEDQDKMTEFRVVINNNKGNTNFLVEMEDLFDDLPHTNNRDILLRDIKNIIGFKVKTGEEFIAEGKRLERVPAGATKNFRGVIEGNKMIDVGISGPVIQTKTIHTAQLPFSGLEFFKPWLISGNRGKPLLVKDIDDFKRIFRSRGVIVDNFEVVDDYGRYYDFVTISERPDIFGKETRTISYIFDRSDSTLARPTKAFEDYLMKGVILKKPK